MLQFIALIAILVVLLSSRSHKDVPSTIPPAVSKAPQLSAMEEEELRKQRKKFDEEMEAFQEMLNYNADVAYGINKEIK